MENQTNATYNQVLWMEYKPWITFWMATMLALSVIGVFGNLSLIATILSSNKLRAGCGALITHLLFINATLCLFHLPILTITTYFIAPLQLLPPVFCRISVLLYYSALYAVDWVAMLVSINRFMAIVFPHQYNEHFSSYTVSFTMISASWAIVFSCNILLFLGVGGGFQSTKPWGACGIAPAKDSMVYPMITVICVTFPIGLEGAVYLTIFAIVGWRTWTKRKKVVNIAERMRQRRNSVMRNRYKSVKMLSVTYLWYCGCFLPAPIASSLFPKEYSSLPLLQLFLRVLLLCGYSTVPFLYLAMSTDYRSRWLFLWSCLLRTPNKTNPSSAGEILTIAKTVESKLPAAKSP